MFNYNLEYENAAKKQLAWLKVGQLASEAAELLLTVNEGCQESAKLMWIAEKAEIQVQLWDTKVRAS